MRIKAVLRDTEILKMTAGSKDRILAAAKKNVDRLINLPSLLKVMGLTFDDRCVMLEAFRGTKLHVWLSNDIEQHLIYLTENTAEDSGGYQWQ